MRFKIKERQLREHYDLLKIKEIANEMRQKEQFGLQIVKNKLGLKSLSFLENYTHLKGLSVYGITKDISSISQLTNLKELALCGLKLKNVDFLKPLHNLEYLWLQGCQIENINALYELEKLKAIRLFNSRKIDNIDFIASMKSLQYVNIDWCSNITKFPNLKNLTHLRRVFIDTASRLNDISGIAKAENLEDLIVLNTKKLPTNCFDDFIEHPTLKGILIGVNSMNTKQYKETKKRVPKRLQMDGFYGTKNEKFELE